MSKFGIDLTQPERRAAQLKIQELNTALETKSRARSQQRINELDEICRAFFTWFAENNVEIEEYRNGSDEPRYKLVLTPEEEADTNAAIREMRIQSWERNIEQKREQIITELRRLAEDMTILADRMEKQPDRMLNSCGEVQGRGLTIDLAVAEYETMKKMLAELR